MSTTRTRAGFTAIEAAVAIAVLLALTSMSVPALMGALRQGRVNEAANGITKAWGIARQYARTRVPESDHYGVVVVNEPSGAWVGVTRGATASSAALLMDGAKPVCQLRFNRNVVVFDGTAPLVGERGWFCQYRTGYPLAAAHDAEPAVIAGLSLRTLDGVSAAAVAVYEVGLVHLQGL